MDTIQIGQIVSGKTGSFSTWDSKVSKVGKINVIHLPKNKWRGSNIINLDGPNSWTNENLISIYCDKKTSEFQFHFSFRGSYGAVSFKDTIPSTFFVKMDSDSGYKNHPIDPVTSLDWSMTTGLIGYSTQDHNRYLRIQR
jgi:hypothetical protein